MLEKGEEVVIRILLKNLNLQLTKIDMNIQVITGGQLSSENLVGEKS